MKKGFTLIELLAVIVILAIIALIATPIVLNIINETKSNAALRSADFYLDAVEMSVAQSILKNQSIKDGTYHILENGNICLEDYVLENNKYVCKDKDNNTDNNELEVEVNGEKPKEGTITIATGNISDVSINLNDKVIVKNNKGELVYQIEPICKAVTTATTGNIPEGKYESGDEYICEVKKGVTYRFFVLNLDGNNVNLLMEKDLINNTNWINKADYLSAGGDQSTWTDYLSESNGSASCESSSWSNTSKGPITAMKTLNEATSDWRDELIINENYNDKNGIYSNFKISSKARLPKYDELEQIDCNTSTTLSCPLWAVNYMWEGEAQYPGRTEGSNPSNAYWLLDAQQDEGQCDANAFFDWGNVALSVDHNGYIVSHWSPNSPHAGIRPVITVPIDMIG